MTNQSRSELLRALANAEPLTTDQRSFLYTLVESAPEQAAQAGPNGLEFTDWGRAAILWVLWHHQGASSEVGQPLRFALGMGAHDRLNDWQVADAKRWGERTGRTPGSCRDAAAAPQAAPVAQEREALLRQLVGALELAWHKSGVVQGLPAVEAAIKAGSAWSALAATPQAQESDADGPLVEGWQLSVAEGHSGYGVYAHMTEYPEEGAVLVLELPQAQAAGLSIAEEAFRAGLSWAVSHPKATLREKLDAARQFAADPVVRLATPQAQAAQPVEHVCGLQGFGALGDVCKACEARSAAQPVGEGLTPDRREALRQKVMRAIDERIGNVRRNFHAWDGWPGTWAFADVAVSALADDIATPQPAPSGKGEQSC